MLLCYIFGGEICRSGAELAWTTSYKAVALVYVVTLQPMQSYGRDDYRDILQMESVDPWLHRASQYPAR
jgi:hypothetical protein